MRQLFFYLLLLVPQLCEAQDFRKVSCRFLALDSSAPPPALLNVTDKGVEIPCTVTPNKLSAPRDCFARDNVIHFIATRDRSAAATALIPARANAVILVFAAAPKLSSTLPWRVFVIEDNPTNFPFGGAFVANFHSQDIRFLIGETKLMLHPAGFRGLAGPAQRDAFNMAPVLFQFQNKDTWLTASESSLRFLPGMRYLIFACNDPESGRPRIAIFKDHIPLAAPPTMSASR